MKSNDAFLSYSFNYEPTLPFIMEYTGNEEELPEYYFESKNIEDLTDTHGLQLPDKLGKIKHVRWRFEDEIRYMFKFQPNKLFPLAPFTTEEKVSVLLLMTNRAKNLPELKENFYLEIHKSALSRMVITLSPYAKTGHRITVTALINDLCSEYKDSIQIQDSVLKGNWTGLS